MRCFRILGILYSVYLYTSLLLAAPPPPSISSTNLIGGRVRIDEAKWNKDTNVEVVGTVNLTGNREVKGLWLYEKNDSRVRLNDHLLAVGAGGLNAYYDNGSLGIMNGRLTASGASLVIRSHTYGSSIINKYGETNFYSFAISAIIEDHKDHKVGLVVNGAQKEGQRGIVNLTGNYSNTFTGDVIVEGTLNKLSLSKTGGATAIKGNIYIKNNAAVIIGENNQISDSSIVTLSGRNSAFGFTGAIKDVSEKIRAVVVADGRGIVSFSHNPKEPNDQSKKTLFLDDLIINKGASLYIMRWQEGRDHLLVRKDSKNLADALKKMTIEGWGKNQVYLKDYDKDYYSIEAAPEPTTYGAILGGLGLGAYLIRRRGLRPIFWARARWQRAPLRRT